MARSQAGGGAGNPSAPGRTPGFPANGVLHRLFGFDGLNWKAGQTQIGDQELLWCDNLHPIAPGKLRAMADLSASVYTASGTTIDGQPQAFNLGPQLYFAVPLADGSLIQIKGTTPYTVTQILPAGSLSGEHDFTQWGSQFLIIVSKVTNGYWIWDGTSLFGAGSIGPLPNIISGGANYASAPAVTAFGGSGSGATFTATIENGAVSKIVVTDPGSGWTSTDPNPIALLFDDGVNLVSASGTATTSDGVIVNAIVDDGGSGYTGVPSVTVTDGGGGSGSGAVVEVDGVNGGIITSLKVVDGGSGYGLLGAPTIAFSGGGGTGATGHVTLANGVITSFTMSNSGDGYEDNPEVVFISATGTGAQGTAVMTGKTITDVTIDKGGSGYTGTVYVVFNAAAGPAYATVSLMPFGVDGVSVATYLSRVWVSHYPDLPYPPSLLFTDTEDPANFGPPGGAVPLTQEYLRYKLAHLVPTSNFLYLIGDSSIGYIGGVQTSSATASAPAITTFSIINVDPQTGTTWKDSVYPFGQSVVFVNTFGVHLITGGTIRKISTQIDDLFASDILDIWDAPPSTAVGDLNGVHVFGITLNVRDPTTFANRRLVLMSDGKRWWTYSPRIELASIFTSEIDSSLAIWGHDGSSIYLLFQEHNNIQKKLRTKLYDGPNIVAEKTAMAVYAVLQPTQNATLAVKPVTESGLGALIAPGLPTFMATPYHRWGRSAARGFGNVLGWEIVSTSSEFDIVELDFLIQELDLRVP